MNHACEICGASLSVDVKLHVLEDSTGQRAMVCESCVVYVAGVDLEDAESVGAKRVNDVETNEHGDVRWRLNDEPHRTDGPATEGASDTRWWYLNGQLHRTDGPAVEWVDGTKWWYLNGQRHRTDGPAIERASGTKEWWINDQRHRTDGPAIERVDGSKWWYLNGKHLTQEEWIEKLKTQ